MRPIRRITGFLLVAALLAPGAAIAEPRTTRTAPTPVLDSGLRQVRTMASSSGRRNQGAGPNPALAAGFALGAVLGGYVGLYVAARNCHCESDKGVVVGMLLGGSAGLWIAHKLARP